MKVKQSGKHEIASKPALRCDARPDPRSSISSAEYLSYPFLHPSQARSFVFYLARRQTCQNARDASLETKPSQVELVLLVPESRARHLTCLRYAFRLDQERAERNPRFIRECALDKSEGRGMALSGNLADRGDVTVRLAVAKH